MDRFCKKKIVQDENENGIDFVEHHDKNVVFTIFTYLDDIADIHRASAVSHLWQRFVLNNANDLYQNLCFRKAPGMRSISSLLGREDSFVRVYGNRYSITSEFLESTHKVYSSLLQALSISVKAPRNCLKCVLGSSSTNRYPEQSIVHILEPEAKYMSHNSYWSSRGVSDSKTNESILLELDSSFCIVTEIDIHPYKALSEPGSPIYSPRFVRFQMGHPKLTEDENVDLESLPWQELNDNKYAWTYTSQEFPMIQEDSLQRFKLQEPVICVGGILKIELLGRAQRNELDGMYYTWYLIFVFLILSLYLYYTWFCSIYAATKMRFLYFLLSTGSINHVNVLGHPLAPAFEVTVNSDEMKLHSRGNLTFTFCEDDINRVLQRISPPEEDRQSGLEQDELEEADYNTPAALQIRRLMKLLYPDEWDDLWGDLD